MGTRWWKNFEDIFIRFDVIHERDGQTDRQTDRHCLTAKTALASHRAVMRLDVTSYYGHQTASLACLAGPVADVALGVGRDGLISRHYVHRRFHGNAGHVVGRRHF